MQSTALSNMRLRNIQNQAFPSSRPRMQMGLPPQEETPVGVGINTPAGAPNFQQPPILTPQVEEQEPETDASRYYQLIKTIESETTPGLTAYTQALQNRPKVEDYKPNWLTRIGAGLSGAAAGMRDPAKGFETAYNINRAPYREALSEYQGNLVGLKEQAEMEQSSRNARMKAILDASALGVDYERFAETKRHNMAGEKTADLTARHAGTRAEAALVTANNSARNDYDYQAVAGGIQAINKHDPADSRLIPVRTLDEARVEISRSLAQSAATQAAAATTNAQANVDRTAEAKNQNVVGNALAGARIGVQIRGIEERAATAAANRNRVSINDMDSARALAMSEMATEPGYAKFFAKNADVSTFSAEDLADLSEAIEERITEIYTRNITKGGR